MVLIFHPRGISFKREIQTHITAAIDPYSVLDRRRVVERMRYRKRDYLD